MYSGTSLFPWPLLTSSNPALSQAFLLLREKRRPAAVSLDNPARTSGNPIGTRQRPRQPHTVRLAGNQTAYLSVGQMNPANIGQRPTKEYTLPRIHAACLNRERRLWLFLGPEYPVDATSLGRCSAGYVRIGGPVSLTRWPRGPSPARSTYNPMAPENEAGTGREGNVLFKSGSRSPGW